MDKNRILIVEDEFITGTDLTRRLEKAGYEVVGLADTGRKAIALAGEMHPDLILMDISLKEEMNGIHAAQEIKKIHDLPVVFLTANSDEATVNEALRSDPFGYITKPVDDRSLKTAIRIALYKHDMEGRVKASEEQFRNIANLLDESIFLIARNYAVKYLNQCAANLAGKDVEACTDKHIQALLPEPIGKALGIAVAEVFETGTPFRKTGRYEFNHTTVWLDTSILPFHRNGKDVTHVLGISRDITARILLELEMEKKGVGQLERNMEQFQILNDKIRNPLQIISSLATIEKGPGSQQILAQVAIIDHLVDRLDSGWAESKKVRSFLLRHYGHGENQNDQEKP